MRKCLIISNGPPPTPEQPQVEGGGLRCWGLAQGIKDNSKDKIEITLAYNSDYKKNNFTKNWEGIKITCWNIDSIESLLRGFDTIIVSYCMGQLSVRVVDLIKPTQQLILDCYVPIYMEVSARDSAHLDDEFNSYISEIDSFRHVLRRGDLFLCASSSQKRYYEGVLSAIGRLNPVTYVADQILVVPYGIFSQILKPKKRPITEIVKSDNKIKKILWFGGLYPWFDISNLIEAIAEINQTIPVRLIIVGARNPFNTHPDFIARYDNLVRYLKSHPASAKIVILHDWVKFETRFDWYLDSDLVVMINKPGIENELAWRTRLVDFMGARLPILTNGGDPLGEYLISREGALRISGGKKGDIAKVLTKALNSESKLKELSDNLNKVRREFLWPKVTKKLSVEIVRHSRSPEIVRYGIVEVQSLKPKTRLSKIIFHAKSLPAHNKQYGRKSTVTLLKSVVDDRIVRRISGNKKTPIIKFISHQLDMSGAPFVFIDLVNKFVAENPKTAIEFHTFPPAQSDNITLLNKAGIKPKIHQDKYARMDFSDGDIVVLNTVGYTKQFLESIYFALDKNIIKKLIWYIHEDDPNEYFNAHEKKKIKDWLDQGKLVIFTPARRITLNFQKFFDDIENVRLQRYQIKIPKKFHKVRAEEDFNTLRFILPGNVADGRKGQLPIFYAFVEFKKRYYDRYPSKYRDFKLTFVSLSNDFISRQILNHARKGLGEHFEHFGLVSRKRSLKLIYESNITICYSIREALPLFVFEGMISGHPILRNDSSGKEEQLFEGKNGFYLDRKSFQQLIKVIEKISNKHKTTNEELSGMSAFSYKTSKKYENNSYKKLISEIKAK